MEQGDLALSERDFERIQARLYRVAGISLSAAKQTLVVSRLHRIVRNRGLSSFSAYIDYLEARPRPGDEQEFVNALTTNLTRFYREDHHFEHLVGTVGALTRRPPRMSPDGRPRLRIWSAGCSTGQEPYTVAMALLGALPELRRWDFLILATDIDTAVLEKAAAGIYPQSELQGLSAERAAPFEKLGDGRVVVPAAVRERVAFKPLNLMHDWPMRGPFDAIFCRNVAIYFDKPTQTEVFRRFRQLLAPEGFLYIGHSENIGDNAAFHPVGKTIYRPKPTASRSAA